MDHKESKKVVKVQTQEQRSKFKPSDGFLRQGGGLEKANLCGQNHKGKKEGFSDKTGRKAKKYEVGHQGILKALPPISKIHVSSSRRKRRRRITREHDNLNETFEVVI
ncbi:hypothetical protein YC2023_020818 [Brassica napus]